MHTKQKRNLRIRTHNNGRKYVKKYVAKKAPAQTLAKVE